MVRHLLVVLAALGTSLPSTTHAWGLPPTLAKKAPFSRSMKAPLADINNQGPICELTSTGGHLSVDFTVAPWMEKSHSRPALFHDGILSNPAPILRAFPGDTVRVRVRSELENNVKSGRDDATGLSLHGVRLTTAADKGGLRSRLAGPTLAIHTFTISGEHAPGMHWYHVGGDPGFVGAFYVLPKKISADATDATVAAAVDSASVWGNSSRLLIFQSHEKSSSSSSYMVNGKEQPEALSLVLGEGKQVDLAHGGGSNLLEVGVSGDGCDLQLLALDGIDLEQPRVVETVALIPRQRARVMVTCRKEGNSALLARGGGDVADVRREEDRQQKKGEEEGMQRLLILSVTKGTGKNKGRTSGMPLSMPLSSSTTTTTTTTSLPPAHMDMVSGDIGAYLRNLEGESGLLLSSCAVTLFPRPMKNSCPAGREICPLSTPAPVQEKKGEGKEEFQQRHRITLSSKHSTLREIFVTLTHTAPSASVRLSPAQPFQVLDFIPAYKQEKTNPYLTKWGQYGEWRDVLPPLKGTFRLRYLAQEEAAQDDPCVEYDGFNILDAGEEQREVGERGVKQRMMMWNVMGHEKEGGEEPSAVVVGTREAYLLIQAMIGEEKQDPEWVKESIKEVFQEYLMEEDEGEPATDDDTIVPIENKPTSSDDKRQMQEQQHQQQQDTSQHLYDVDALAKQVQHRALTILSSSPRAIPIQMPRRYLPSNDTSCNNTSLVWPTAFTLHLKNSSFIYPVVSKLHGLLAEDRDENLPQLCSVNVTLLSDGTSAVAATAAAPPLEDEGQHGLLHQKVPSRVIVLLAFAGGVCILLIGLLVYRRLMTPVGPPRSSRRSSVHHDPTTIETQITELDDSSSLGIKGSHHLRHNSRSRTNSLIGVNPALFPTSRLSSSSSGSATSESSGAAVTGAGRGGSLTNMASQQHQQQHYRSASSLPADMASLGHGRSLSMPHHSGFGFFFPRRQSTESIHLSNSGTLGASGDGVGAGATAAGAGARG